VEFEMKAEMKSILVVITVVFSLLSATVVFSKPSWADNSSYEKMILTLSRIYRKADTNTLLSFCTASGKRYYKRLFRRYGLKRYKRRMRYISRFIYRVTLSEIFVRKDGAVRLKYTFTRRIRGRKLYYKNSISVIRRNKQLFIIGR